MEDVQLAAKMNSQRIVGVDASEAVTGDVFDAVNQQELIQLADPSSVLLRYPLDTMLQRPHSFVPGSDAYPDDIPTAPTTTAAAAMTMMTNRNNNSSSSSSSVRQQQQQQQQQHQVVASGSGAIETDETAETTIPREQSGSSSGGGGGGGGCGMGFVATSLMRSAPKKLDQTASGFAGDDDDVDRQ